jgi:hypothetical protein
VGVGKGGQEDKKEAGTNINSKWIKDLNINLKLKQLQEAVGNTQNLQTQAMTS